MIAILLHDSWQRQKAIQLTSFVALATPGAAILIIGLANNLTQPVLGALLVVAGGSLLPAIGWVSSQLGQGMW